MEIQLLTVQTTNSQLPDSMGLAHPNGPILPNFISMNTFKTRFEILVLPDGVISVSEHDEKGGGCCAFKNVPDALSFISERLTQRTKGK